MPGYIVLIVLALLVATCHYAPAHSAEPAHTPLVATVAPTFTPALIVYGSTKEVVRVQADGQLYWNGRLVTTDADFRAAMLQAIRGMRCSQ